MTDKYDIRIVEYSDELAAKVADMWNKWNELWPGGFTQGVPYTEEKVREQMDTSKRISQLIAIDEETGEAVGSCSVHEHWRDSEATYVGVLGVSPEALNKKVGKRLLLRAVKIAIENGYTRLDLNTWAGNLRAVPLYKKIGLMWDPEGGGVTMQDYIPGIIQHPLSAPFFEGRDEHAWYDLQKREITQAPDDMTENNMAVYKYRFEDKDGSLDIVVDRIGRGITGIRRESEDGTVNALAYVSHQEVVCGISATYVLEVENNREDEVNFSVGLNGFEGIHLQETRTKTKIKSGETFRWEVPFELDSTAELHRTGFRGPSIIASLHIDKEKSELQTGLRINPVADIHSEWGDCRIGPGGKVSLPLNIQNRYKTVRGKIVLTSPDDRLKVTPQSEEIVIQEKGFGGVTVELEADPSLQSGTYHLQAHLEVETEDYDGNTINIETRKFRIPVYCLHDGLAQVGELDSERAVQVVTDTFNATVYREGGRCIIRPPEPSGRNSLIVDYRIGPPFGIDPFRYSERQISSEQTHDSTVVTVSAEHPERPLHIDTKIVFPRYGKTVRTDFWVTNTGSEPHTFQARMYGPQGGINLGGTGTMFIPLKEGIVEGPVSSVFLFADALPNEPEEWSEEWIAQYDGRGISGQYWSPKGVTKIRLIYARVGRLEYDDITLGPGERKLVSQLWNMVSGEKWSDVQQAWAATTKGEHDLRDGRYLEKKTRFVFEINAQPTVLEHKDSIKVKVSLSSASKAPLPGEMTVLPPPGYEILSISHESAEVIDGKGIIPGVVILGDQDFEIELSPTEDNLDEFNLAEGELLHRSISDTQGTYKILQLGSSTTTVEVTESVESEKRVFTVSNGTITFKVSPDYGGCLFSLKNSSSTELLATAFPTPAPKVFVDNYYGGVQPLLCKDGPDTDLTKAKTNKEAFDARPVEVNGIWKGVELSWTGTVQKITRGVDFCLRYLTAPGSPVVLLNWVIKNKTKAPLTFNPTLFVDHAFDGDLSDLVIDSKTGIRNRTFHPSEIPTAFVTENNLVWIRKGDSTDNTEGLGLLIPGEHPKGIVLAIQGFVFTGLYDDSFYLRPGDEKTVNIMLLVDPPSLELMEKLRGIIPYLL